MSTFLSRALLERAVGCTCALALTLALMACAQGKSFENDGGEDDDGTYVAGAGGDTGAGGQGGDTTHGPAAGPSSGPGTPSSSGASSSSSSASASSPASSSTGSGGCDGAVACDVCGNCALSGPCAPETNTCFNDPDCSALLDCFDTCGQVDDACLDACLTAHPTGTQLYGAMMDCAICTTCPLSCNGC